MVAFSQDGHKVFPVSLAYPIFERENNVLSFDGKKARETLLQCFSLGGF